MPLAAAQIEDGTGKTTALVYGSEADCEAYLAMRGRTGYASLSGNIGSVEKKTVHLIRGTEYVEAYAAQRVLGSRATQSQRLLFPRAGVVVDGVTLPSGEVPEAWKNATFEAAELSARGEALYDVVDADRAVKRKRISSAIETEWFGPETRVRYFPLVEELLRPFLSGTGSLERG